MPDCLYCERSFEDESAIREHLYGDHDYDELSRIDSKRVDEYVEEHGLESSDETDNGGAQGTTEGITLDDSGGSFSSERWELEGVRSLSTTEIRDKLAELGIETTEKSFRDRATDVNAATALADQWEDEYEVSVTGYDHDFLWMAAEVLWERWTPDIPNKERIYDFYHKGSDLFEKGEDTEGCQDWLTAWDFIAAVTPDERTSVEAADDYLPTFLSLDHFLRTLSGHLETAAETDPSYHERRIEFCREVCDRFPDTDDELLLDLRHALANSFGALGRDDERAAELDSLIEEYPDDPWAYFKLAEQYRQLPPEATSGDDLERAVELYQQALERDIEQQPRVEERLEEVEHRLDEVRNKKD
jgi:tetratricopeptide (TPR) repeat protein